MNAAIELADQPVLYLIRHAESENNARPAYQRVCDPGITRRGQLQAQKLAEWFKGIPLDLLVTSPFRRTLETTRWILSQRPQPVQVWHNVFENGGCYHGHDEASFAGASGLGRHDLRGQLTASDEHELELIIDEEITPSGWWNGRPRESIDQSRQRAGEVAERLVETMPGIDSAMALVIHADFKRELLGVMLEGCLSLDRIGVIANAAVSVLRFRDDAPHWDLLTLNSVTHLPARLITSIAH